MQEQNFENRVRHKLGGLLLEPSAPVWEEVERELAKKKRRRRFFFFLVLLVPACTGIALYVGRSPDPRTAANGSRAVVVDTATGPTRQATTNARAGHNTGLQASPNSASGLPAQKKPLVTQPSGEKPEQSSSLRIITRKAVVLIHVQNTATSLQRIAGKPEEKPVTAITNPPEKLAPASEVLFRVRGKVDSIQPQKKEAPVTRTLSPFTPSFNGLSQGGAPTVHRKWQWSLHAAVGRSAVRSSLFRDAQSVRADFQTGSAAGAPPASRTPSAVDHGGVYTIGVDMHKSLTRKLSLVTGLHYRLAQTRVTVGATVARDTSVVSNTNSFLSVSGYYNTGAAQVLTNNYHFLELPLALEWQPLSRVPLRLQASITGARMIAADAVLFGRQSRLYYKENNAYHKTQLYFGTAIDYRLMQSKGFTLRAGPYLHYGMTTLEKRGFVDQHLFAAGIKTNISF